MPLFTLRKFFLVTLKEAPVLLCPNIVSGLYGELFLFLEQCGCVLDLRNLTTLNYTFLELLYFPSLLGPIKVR